MWGKKEKKKGQNKGEQTGKTVSGLR